MNRNGIVWPLLSQLRSSSDKGWVGQKEGASSRGRSVLIGEVDKRGPLPPFLPPLPSTLLPLCPCLLSVSVPAPPAFVDCAPLLPPHPCAAAEGGAGGGDDREREREGTG